MKELTITEGEHSRLAPSKAHRWMRCAGSVLLPQKEEKRQLKGPAWQGTVGHAIAAAVLEGEIESVTEGRKLPIRYEGKLRGQKLGIGVARKLESYLNLCKTKRMAYKGGSEWIEFHGTLAGAGLDEIHGTVDYAYLHDEVGLYVADLKTGRWPVDAPYNPQLMIYGLIMLRSLYEQGISRPEKVTLSIIQPGAWNMGDESRWHPERRMLWNFFDDLEKAVARVEKAESDPEAYLNEGEWCRFCPAHDFCPLKKEGENGPDLKVTRRLAPQ